MATAPKKVKKAASEPVEQGAAGVLPVEQEGAGESLPLAVSGSAQEQQDQPAVNPAAVEQETAPAAAPEGGEQQDQEQGEQAPAPAVPAARGEWEMPAVSRFPVAVEFRNASGLPVSLSGLKPLAPGAVEVAELSERQYRRAQSLLSALARVRGWDNEIGVQVNESAD